MTFFTCFISVSFLSILGLLFYNELIQNDKTLTKLEIELQVLQEKLKCAKSDCICDKAVEYRKELSNFEKEFEYKNALYSKIYKKFILQEKLIGALKSRISLKIHPESPLQNCKHL